MREKAPITVSTIVWPQYDCPSHSYCTRMAHCQCAGARSHTHAATRLCPGKSLPRVQCPPKFVTGLLDLPLSNYYLTPRGVIVENSGVIAQPMLQLFFNLYESDGPVNNVTGMVGIWNSIHSKQRGPDIFDRGKLE